MATLVLSELLHSQLLVLSPELPPSPAALRSLASVVGPNLLLNALDLLDSDKVARIRLPNGRILYQVSGSSAMYTVLPNVGTRGYCHCPAFAGSCIGQDTQVTCKHLLAVKMGIQLDSFVEKSFDLKWIAGLSSGFAVIPAP